MSWVAPKNAVPSAQSAICRRCCAGSVKAMPHSVQTSPIWERSSHERRLPSAWVSSGIGSLSTSGAHTHLNPQQSPTQLMKPMVFKSTPLSRSQNESVPKTSSSGKPDENPRKSIRTASGSR